jgi:mono/diheme cytochrome c family protein
METSHIIYLFGGTILSLYLIAAYLLRKMNQSLTQLQGTDTNLTPMIARSRSTISVNNSLILGIGSLIAIGLVGRYIYNQSKVKPAAPVVEAVAEAAPKPIDLATAVVLTDETSLKAGAERFKNLCASCHGQSGEGNVGPNFTDNYWLHGGEFKDICSTISKGVVEKGMIAWSAQLSDVEIKEVASYILSMEGTNIPKGKAPQGEKYDRKEVINFAIRPAAAVAVNIPKIPLKGNASHGELLFNAILGCAHCHGSSSIGHLDNRNLRNINKRYGAEGFKVYDTVMEIGRLGTAMPPWGHLSLEEKKDIKTFIFSVQEKL